MLSYEQCLKRNGGDSILSEVSIFSTPDTSASGVEIDSHGGHPRLSAFADFVLSCLWLLVSRSSFWHYPEQWGLWHLGQRFPRWHTEH